MTEKTARRPKNRHTARDPVTGLTQTEARFIEQWIADGRKSASATYKKIFPGVIATTAASNAWRLLHRPPVVAYLAKIDAKAETKLVQKIVLTREWIIDQLIDNVQKAKEESDYSASNTALRMLGLEVGMGVERKELGKAGEFANLSTEELRRDITERAAKLGIALHVIQGGKT